VDRRNFLAATAATMVPNGATAQTKTLRERVLGAWRILDAETVNVKAGAVGPWLGRPRPYSGIIIYLPSGLMSVQIGAARPAPRAGTGFGTMSSDDIQGYAATWYAYYGRFEVDEAHYQVRHFVEESLFAFETGKTLVRSMHLENDVLTLRTVNLEKGPDGETFNRLTWRRI
jgi:hypothetical protein